MIYQHLQLRCRSGSYDTGGLGYKTAAVSDAFLSLPGSIRSDLDSAIKEYSSLPDSVGRNDRYGRDNRGILRIINYKDFVLAIRNFRVYDRCDTMGTVSYVCTLIFSEDDADMILRRPWLLSQLKYYEFYEDLVNRCDPSSLQPVTANEYITEVLRNDLHSETSKPKRNITILLNSLYFSRLISCLTYRLSSNNGIIALTHPNISLDEWDNSGGSEIGEMILTETLRLLPDILKHSFSGISYWNASPYHDSLSPRGIGSFLKRPSVALRLITWDNNDLDMLSSNSETMLIDTARGKIRNVSINTDNYFGTLLWFLSDTKHLQELYSYIGGILTSQEMYKPELLDITSKIYVLHMIPEAAEQAAFEKVGKPLDKSPLSIDKSKLLDQLLRVLSGDMKNNETLIKFAGSLVDEDIIISTELENCILEYISSDSNDALSIKLCNYLINNSKTEKLCRTLITVINNGSASTYCIDFLHTIYNKTSISDSFRLTIIKCFTENNIFIGDEQEQFLSDLFSSLGRYSDDEREEAVRLIILLLGNMKTSSGKLYSISFGSVSPQKSADILISESGMIKPFAMFLPALMQSADNDILSHWYSIFTLLLNQSPETASETEEEAAKLSDDSILMKLAEIRMNNKGLIIWNNISRCFTSLDDNKKYFLLKIASYDNSLIGNISQTLHENKQYSCFGEFFFYIFDAVRKSEDTPDPMLFSVFTGLIEKKIDLYELCKYAETFYPTFMKENFLYLAKCIILSEYSELSYISSYDNESIEECFSKHKRIDTLDNTAQYVKNMITSLENGGMNNYLRELTEKFEEFFDIIADMPADSYSRKIYSEYQEKYNWKTIHGLNMSRLRKMLEKYNKPQSLNFDEAYSYLKHFVIRRLRDKNDDSFDYNAAKEEVFKSAAEIIYNNQQKCIFLAVVYCLITGDDFCDPAHNKGVLTDICQKGRKNITATEKLNMLNIAESHITELIAFNDQTSSATAPVSRQNAKEALDKLYGRITAAQNRLKESSDTEPENVYKTNTETEKNPSFISRIFSFFISLFSKKHNDDKQSENIHSQNTQEKLNSYPGTAVTQVYSPSKPTEKTYTPEHEAPTPDNHTQPDITDDNTESKNGINETTDAPESQKPFMLTVIFFTALTLISAGIILILSSGNFSVYHLIAGAVIKCMAAFALNIIVNRIANKNGGGNK